MEARQIWLQTPPKMIMLIFCLMQFLYGCFLGSIGPLVAIFSYFTSNPQTSYSYLFVVMSLSEVGSCLLSNIILNRYNPQSLLIFLLTVIILCCCLLMLSFGTAALTISFMAMGFSYMLSKITVLSSILIIYAKHNPPYYMTIVGISFGIGATTVPALVLLLQQRVFLFFIVTAIATLAILWSLTLPEIHKQEQKQINSNQHVKLSRKSQLCICALLALYIIEELGLASWMPTYSIQKQVSDAHSAGLYSLLFWTANLISRLLCLYVSGSFTSLLKWCLYCLCCSTLICLLLQTYQHYQLLCIFAPISSGFILSNSYSFYVSLAVDNRIFCSSQNTSNFALGATIGEGLFIAGAGYSMKAFGVESLFVIEFTVAVLSLITFRQALLSFEADKLKHEEAAKGSELPLLNQSE